MTAEDARQVYSSGELAAGDEIEAWHNGKLFHRGKVIRTVRATDLFWIVDARTGMRRLIDTEALVILRAERPGNPSARQPAGALAAGEPSTIAHSAGGTPAPNVPLFQAPGLAS